MHSVSQSHFTKHFETPLHHCRVTVWPALNWPGRFEGNKKNKQIFRDKKNFLKLLNILTCC